MRTLSYLMLSVGLTACAAAPDTTANDEQAFDLCLPSGWSSYTGVPESADEYRGAPAWANDGTNRALAAFQKYDRMRPGPTDDPCAWDRRNFSWQLFSVTPGASLPKPAASAWQPGEVIELYYMKSAGYALVKVFDESRTLLTYVRAPLAGGTPEPLGTQQVYQGNPLDYRGHLHDIVPSPDGTQAADVDCHVTDENPDGSYNMVANPDCTVRFLDMTKSPVTQVGQQWSLTLAAPLASYPPQVGEPWRLTDGVMWSKTSVLTVTDHVSSAFTVDPTHGPTAGSSLPACDGPNTSGTKIDAAGNRLGVKHHLFLGDRVEVVSPTSYTSTFGCL
jgi:hypothetical protein